MRARPGAGAGVGEQGSVGTLPAEAVACTAACTRARTHERVRLLCEPLCFKLKLRRWHTQRPARTYTTLRNQALDVASEQIALAAACAKACERRIGAHSKLSNAVRSMLPQRSICWVINPCYKA